jgi:RND family efflux transporter MFP subunit
MTRTRWLLGSLLLGMVLIAGCRNKVELTKPDPLEVLWAHPATRVITDYEEFTGKTDARNTVDLRALSQGKLVEVRFRDGSVVRKGELLAIIDPDPYKVAVQQSKAEVLKQEANVAVAKATFDPIDQLYQSRNETKQNYDTAKATLENAVAAVVSAKATLAQAELNLQYTNVFADFDGRITRRLVDPGNIVTNAVTILATMVAEDPIYVYFDVDERTMLKLNQLSRDGKLGGSWGLARRWYRPLRLPVRLGLSNEEGRFPSADEGIYHAGVIDYVSPRVDTGTGTVQMRAVFPNPILQDGNRALQPGLFARIQVPVGAPRPALLVPESALGTEQGRRYLYVLGPDEPYEDKAGKKKTKAMPQKVEVDVGTKDQELIVIERVTNPPDVKLTADSRIVVVGLQRVQEKAPVTTTQQPESANANPLGGRPFTPPTVINK